MVAAALWYPYLAEPRERVVAWGADSYRVFADLAGEEGSGVTMMPGTEVLPAQDRGPLVGLRGARSGARPPACRVRRRVVVHRPGRRHAGLPAVAARAAGPSRRHAHPDQPRRAAAAVRPGRRRRQLLGAGLPPAREGRHDATGPRAGGAGGGGRPRPGGHSTRPDRRTSCRDRARSWSAGPSSRGTGAGPRPRRRPPTSSSGPPGSSPSSPAPASWVTAWDSGRRAPPYAWRREGRTVHCYGQGGAGVTLSWGCAAEVARRLSEAGDSADVSAGWGGRGRERTHTRRTPAAWQDAPHGT